MQNQKNYVKITAMKNAHLVCILIYILVYSHSDSQNLFVHDLLRYSDGDESKYLEYG